MDQTIYILGEFFTTSSGTDVVIFKNILPKKLAKKLAVFSQTTTIFLQNMTIALVFEKIANIFAENCRRSQKIFGRKLSKIAENCRKSPKIVENRRKL
jgi:hypothetical protein